MFPIFTGNINKMPLNCTFGVESDSNIVQTSVWKYGYFLDEHILHMILLSITSEANVSKQMYKCFKTMHVTFNVTCIVLNHFLV